MDSSSALLAIAHEPPEKTLREAALILPAPSDRKPAHEQQLLMPLHHDVRRDDVDLRRLGAVLAVAYERNLHDFAELLLVEHLGPRTFQSLALIAEVVHGAPSRFSDPARFAFAHGGKDGHPFPVPLETYDESLDILRTSLDHAAIGDAEKLGGFLGEISRVREEAHRFFRGFFNIRPRPAKEGACPLVRSVL